MGIRPNVNVIASLEFELVLRGVLITLSLALLSSLFSSRVVIPVQITSISQIDLFKNYLHLIGPCAETKLSSETTKQKM